MRLDDLLTDLIEAWQTDRSRIIRTVLAMALGVAALTTALSPLAGFRETVDEILTGFGGKAMTVFPRWDPTERRQKAENFDWDDARALAAVSGVTMISLQKTADSVLVKLFNRDVRAKIIGADPNYAVIRNRTVTKGRFLDTTDLVDERRVCVITPAIQKRFFPAGDYLENSLEINGVFFQIVGCLRPLQLPAAFSGVNEENGAVFLPLTACQSLFHQYDYDRIWLSYTRDYHSKKMVRLLKGRVNGILAFRHGKEEIFTIKTLDDFTEQPRIKTVTILVVLCTAAALFLLAGGIGISHVVMVNSIKRKETEAYCLNRLLWESVAFSAAGGCVGMLLGIAGSGFISVFAGLPIRFSWWVLLSGITCPLLVGIAAGGVTAKRAASVKQL